MDRNERRNCGVHGTNKQQCLDKGCCWDSQIKKAVFCFFIKSELSHCFGVYETICITKGFGISLLSSYWLMLSSFDRGRRCGCDFTFRWHFLRCYFRYFDFNWPFRFYSNSSVFILPFFLFVCFYFTSVYANVTYYKNFLRAPNRKGSICP